MPNKRKVSVCLIFSAVLIYLHFSDFTYAQIPQNAAYKEGELIVRFTPKANGLQRTLQEKDATLSLFNGGTVKYSYKLVPGLTLVQLPNEAKVKDKIDLFINRTEILYVEPNYKIYLHSIFPNDTHFNYQWNMHNIGQIHPKDTTEGGGFISGTLDADIDTTEGWSLARNSDITVAVLDTGVDYTHPDLTSNVWRNYDEWYGESNVDDDGQGYNDDIYGYDAIMFGNDYDPIDYRYHGTHCAGIIGAQGDNIEGVTGVCQNVSIMAIQIMPAGSVETFVSQAILGIEYSVEMGAKVLSNSWGFDNYSSLGLKNEIEAADEQGVLFIATAGNDGVDIDDQHPYYPATYDCNNIITVMATDHNDERSIWSYPFSSNWGQTSVDLAAPGSDILSTFPSYRTSAMQYFSTYYETIGGTSMACPHVAAACALVWAANPTLTHLEVKQIIMDTVDPLDSLTNPDLLCVTGGRLNLQKALDKAMPLKIKLYNDRAPTDCMQADPNIFYTIAYANPVTNESDPNFLGDVTNCAIIHYLPEGVDPNFVIASDDGVFDPNDNTVTWDIGTLSPGDLDLVTLTVRMDEYSHPPLGRIWSKAIIYSDSVNPIASVDVADLHPFQLAVDDGVSEVCVDVHGQVHYTIDWKYLWNDPNDPDASKTILDPRKLRDPEEPNIRIHPDHLKIIAYLPPELGPVYPAGNDPNWVVVWEFDPNFAAGDRQDSVELTAPVNNLVVPGSTLTTRFKLFYTIDTVQRFAILDVNTEVCECSGAKIIYVDEDAEGAEDGSSWEDAFIYLDEALAYARACGDQIWVAEGTYTPDGFSDPNATFKLVHNVAVYGGFPAGGGDWNERNWLNNETILSGDVGGGIKSVVTAENIDSSAILDGFTIKDGLVEGVLCTNASPTIRHNRITANGWGIYGLGEESAPVVKNNWIYQNEEDGVYLETGNAQTLIRNNTIADNAGYGIYVEAGDSPDVRNCILWGHPDPNDVHGCTTHYCIVDENGDDNPDFLSGAENYHIDSDSPCIDAGDPNADYSDETDIDGDPRVMVAVVDIGADERDCISENDPNYSLWVEKGKPVCWCYDCFNCGDTNGDCALTYSGDVTTIQNAWPASGFPYNPCADLNKDGAITFSGDLQILINHWPANPVPPYQPGCLDCGACTPIDDYSEGKSSSGSDKAEKEKEVERLLLWLMTVEKENLKEIEQTIGLKRWEEFVQAVAEAALRE